MRAHPPMIKWRENAAMRPAPTSCPTVQARVVAVRSWPSPRARSSSSVRSVTCRERGRGHHSHQRSVSPRCGAKANPTYHAAPSPPRPPILPPLPLLSRPAMVKGERSFFVPVVSGAAESVAAHDGSGEGHSLLEQPDHNAGGQQHPDLPPTYHRDAVSTLCIEPSPAGNGHRRPAA